MTRAIYAFSGDPITYGHVDVVKRAANAFDDVVVAIGVNPDKNYMFSLEERTDMAEQALAEVPNARVKPFNGMLVDYAFEEGADVIVKGVRNTKDFEYEQTLHQAGDSQKLGIDTHILFARPELAHVSSSMVKAIQKEQGDVREYVPLPVKQYLEERVSGQYVIGVTGPIGCGKSYVGKMMEDIGEEKGVPVHNIEMDEIGHEIYELKDPAYVKVRQQVEERFPGTVFDDEVDRRKLGGYVFGDKDALNDLNEIMRKPLQVRLKREMYGKKGIVMINSALLAEANMMDVCNNNIVTVYADADTQRKRIAGRGLTEDQVECRIKSQFGYTEKKRVMEAEIGKTNYGKIWEANNSEGENIREIMEDTFEDIKEYMRI